MTLHPCYRSPSNIRRHDHLSSGYPFKIGIVLVFRDVTEQKQMHLALRDSEQKLRIHAKELQDSNTALKVLLKQRENDKRELEENILTNVRQLIPSIIERLKKSAAMAEEGEYLNILETNL